MRIRLISTKGPGAGLLLFLAGCQGLSPNPPPLQPRLDVTQGAQVNGSPSPESIRDPFDWKVGEPLMHGFVGISFYDEISREGGTSADVDGASGDLDQLPLLGGGAQWKLGGESLDFGVEALFSMEGRANATAFAVGGGGVAVAVDVDLLILDLYGGPFVSTFLGQNMRAYIGAGPLFQFADYEQDDAGVHEDSTGFGFGGYARTGIEFITHSGTMIGVGVLWLNSSVDLNNQLGDLEIEGFQAMITVSRTL
jgi:hypothetical protein